MGDQAVIAPPTPTATPSPPKSVFASKTVMVSLLVALIPMFPGGKEWLQHQDQSQIVQGLAAAFAALRLVTAGGLTVGAAAVSPVAAIWGLITSIPQLISAATQFWAWLNHVSGNDPQGFLLKSGEAFTKLKQAQSPEEYQNVAKELQAIIHRG